MTPGLRSPGGAALSQGAPGGGGAFGLARGLLFEAKPIPRGAGAIPVGDTTGPAGGISPGTGRDPAPDDSGGGGTTPTPAPGDTVAPGGTGHDRTPADPATTSSDPSSDEDSDIPTIAELKTVFPFRGVNDTEDLPRKTTASKAEDSLFLPCFRVLRKHEETGQPIGGAPPGFNDKVTLSTGTEGVRREPHKVRWAHAQDVPTGGRSTSWLCLDNFIDGDAFKVDNDEYKVDFRGKTRMLKFPSGELPDEQGESVAFGRNEVGGGDVVKAYLDEMFVWRHGAYLPVGQVVNTETITEKTKEFTLRAIPPVTTLVGTEGYDKDCGVIDVDGELIVYRGSHTEGGDTVVLEDCRRGVFGTKARPHATLTTARFVPGLYVSCVDGSVSRDSASIGMRRTRGWPSEGTARIVGDDTVEIVHYTAITDAGLLIPESLDADTATRGRGLLRGRFGTDVASHETGDLILWQPSRFWDRYTPRRGADGTAYAGVHEHSDSSYLAFAKTVKNALWRSVRWEHRPEDKSHESTSGEKSARGARNSEKRNVIVVARFDQGVTWDSKSIVDLRGTRAAIPADAKENPKRYLYVFDTPEAANQLDFEADTAEFRVYFKYLPGSYVAQDFEDGESADQPAFTNDWKTTPKLQSFSVEFINRTRVRYSAEIR